MEERPSDRAHEKRYHHHGGERSPSRTKISLKNDPSQCQHQETQTKKTGNGKINGSTVERECTTLSASDSVGIAYSTNSNGRQSPLDSNWKPKQSGKAHPAIYRLGSRGGHGYRNGIMESRNDRMPDLLLNESKELTALPNGISIPLGSGFFMNGYPSNRLAAVPDDDGSGSESGYATPRKRKPLRNSSGKGAESVIQPQAEPTEPPSPDQTEKPSVKVESRTNKPASVSMMTAIPVATPPMAPCEQQRRNFDAKGTGTFSKKQDDRPGKAKPNPNTAGPAKEKDDWTLFKPPPVFPVDNSSAKIVPKISYASKVKENLNKAGGEVPASPGLQSVPPQVPGRPSQVPMSAMKTITSSSFANGPLSSGEGNAYSLSGTLFASTVPPENVALPVDEGGAALVVGEPRKPSLFVYPVTPSSSNMQLALPSGWQADLPTSTSSPAPTPDPASSPTNQKALGDIFQNQWGLSFINDPSAGPERSGVGVMVGVGRGSGKVKVAEVTFQGDCPITLLTPHEASEASSLPPKTHELGKRTSPHSQSHSSVLKVGPPSLRDGTVQTSGPDGQKDAAEARNLGAIVFASPKDSPTLVEPLRASPTNGVSSSLPRGPAHPRGLDRRCSWGSFDLKAAVNYHTKEMEIILNLQKQDPKRVVLYGETKDGPNQ